MQRRPRSGACALTKQIQTARSARQPERAQQAQPRARARSTSASTREAALAGAARYLRDRAARASAPSDLAVVSYHMGIGNLESVIAPTRRGPECGDPWTTGARTRGSSSTPRPLRHPRAWELLAGFGDESSLYYWRVLASQEIMRLWRDDPDALRRARRLTTEKATLEEVYHPEDETESSPTPDDARGRIPDGELVRAPDRPSSLGARVTASARAIGELGRHDPELYRGLRPEALAALIYLAAKVKRDLRRRRALTVTSAVRDRDYQELLVGDRTRGDATEYSLHTTGWSFDIARDYESDAPGAGLPVRARPAARPGDDRLRGRAATRSTSRLRARSARCSCA